MVLITSNLLKLSTGEFDLRTIFTLILTGKHIDKLQNLDQLQSLRWADFSKNNIVRIENLNPNLSTLQFLDLSFNQIQRISCLESLVNLKHLKLHANPIARIADVQGIAPLRSLTHIWFQTISGTDRCPVCSTDGYEKGVYNLNPKLVSLDSKRKHLPELKIPEEKEIDLPAVPSWELELGCVDDIVNPEKVHETLNPLLEEFERKAEECRKRLEESDKMLRSITAG